MHGFAVAGSQWCNHVKNLCTHFCNLSLCRGAEWTSFSAGTSCAYLSSSGHSLRSSLLNIMVGASFQDLSSCWVNTAVIKYIRPLFFETSSLWVDQSTHTYTELHLNVAIYIVHLLCCFHTVAQHCGIMFICQSWPSRPSKWISWYMCAVQYLIYHSCSWYYEMFSSIELWDIIFFSHAIIFVQCQFIFEICTK